MSPLKLPGTNRTTFSESEKLEFLAYLADTGTIAHACKHSGVSYEQVRRVLSEDGNEEFKAAVEYHTLLSREVVELAARDRAIYGAPEIVFVAGRPLMTPVFNPDGSPKMVAVMDPRTNEPVWDPVCGEPLLEQAQEPVVKRKPSDVLMARLLDADPKYSRTQKVQHDHKHAHNHKVGVMLLPPAPLSQVEWQAQLEAQPVPQLKQLATGAPSNAHVVTMEEEDDRDVEFFDGPIPGLPDFLDD